jgi:iron complex transport system substrate-binding protein
VEDVRSDIAAQIARADGSSPTILFLRAYSTGVKAQGSDTMTGQMLKELGCVNIADSEDSLLKDLNMEAIIAADPDYIFVTTMGESKEAALKMVDELLISNPAWSGLTAVKENRYHVLPKELFHMKPNNRWGESYQILADYLYGEK